MDRRSLFSRAATAAPALVLPSVALAAAHPDAGLLRLGAAMERAFAREREVWATYGTVDDGAFEAASQAAADVTAEIVDRIERMPARTLDGLRVKAAAIAWCYADEPFEPDRDATTDVRLAHSIVADLRAMGRAGRALPGTRPVAIRGGC
jgi:hypothetical protein